MAVMGRAIADRNAQTERPLGTGRRSPRAGQQVKMGCVEQACFAQGRWTPGSAT